MDPETILNEYVGQLNTPTVRETIRARMVDAEREIAAATANTINTNQVNQADMNEWIRAASEQMYVRGNPAGEIFLDYPSMINVNGPTLNDYNRRYTFNYNDANAFIRMEPPKMVNVSFVEITGNTTSDDRPIQVMTGKMRIEEGQMQFFEDATETDVKDKMTDIVKKIMFPTIYASLTTGGKKWACHKPGKAVDTLKEMLDEIVSDIIQSTFRLQNKLRNFQYIKG